MLQKTGDTNREKWHKVDWEEARKNPESIELPREDWIYDFDAEKHAEKVFEDLFSKRVDRAA
jgi:N12 class adenine-specific DNA methylase